MGVAVGISIKFDLTGLPANALIVTPTPTRTPTPTQRPAPSQIAPPTPTRTPTRTCNNACTGDCNDNRRVTIDALVRGVNIALGMAALDDCSVFDANADGRLTIGELVAAVGNALNGCNDHSGEDAACTAYRQSSLGMSCCGAVFHCSYACAIAVSFSCIDAIANEGCTLAANEAGCAAECS